MADPAPSAERLLQQMRSGSEAMRIIARDLFDQGDLHGALSRLGRNEAPAFFFDRYCEKRLNEAQLRTILLDMWQMAEFPCRYLKRLDWLEWFRLTGFVSDTGRSAPIEPIEVWRAQAGRTVGLSWTIDRNLALWFHERNRDKFRLSDARMLHGFVPPAQVLGFVDAGRNGEHEVIADSTRKFWSVECEGNDG